MTNSRRAKRVLIAGLALAAGLLTTAPALAAAPANDDFANAFSLGSALSIGTSFTLDDASNQVFEQEPTGTDGRTVWFTWTAPTDGQVQVAACSPNGTVYDTVAVYAGNQVSSLIEQASQGPGLCGVGTSFYAWLGHIYRIQVSGTNGFPHAGSAPLTVDERTAASATISIPPALTADMTGAGHVKPTGTTFDGFDWSISPAPGDCSIDGNTTLHIKYCYAGSMAYTGLAPGQHTLKYRSMDPWGFWSNLVTSTITVPSPTPQAPVTVPTIPVSPVTPATTPAGPIVPVAPAPAPGCSGKPVVKSSSKLSLRTLRAHGARVTFSASSACPLTFTLTVVGHAGTLAAKKGVRTGTALTFRPSRTALRRLHVHRGAHVRVTATSASGRSSITVRVTA